MDQISLRTREEGEEGDLEVVSGVELTEDQVGVEPTEDREEVEPTDKEVIMEDTEVGVVTRDQDMEGMVGVDLSGGEEHTTDAQNKIMLHQSVEPLLMWCIYWDPDSGENQDMV